MRGKLVWDKIFERREGLRFSPRANCYFRDFNPNLHHSEYSICKIENIGSGGLSFLSKQKCPINTKLIFTIALVDKYPSEPIDVLGKIIWIHDSECPQTYQIGVKFVNMLQDDRLYLTRQFN